MFGISVLFITLLVSLSLWFPFRLTFWALALSSLFALFFFLQAIFIFYFSPIEGILVKASLLHKGAGNQYPFVNENPLSSGMKVTVIGSADEGKWIKISTSKGNIGYVYYEFILNHLNPL